MRNVVFLLLYAAFITAGNVFLKMSAQSTDAWMFWIFQAAGNVAGFVGILVYTGLLRTFPLHVAFPLSRGMAVLGVQLVASLLVFHEVFRLTEAAGVVAVAAGVILVGASARPRGEAS